jgi:hypothetical protein
MADLRLLALLTSIWTLTMSSREVGPRNPGGSAYRLTRSGETKLMMSSQYSHQIQWSVTEASFEGRVKVTVRARLGENDGASTMRVAHRTLRVLLQS